MQICRFKAALLMTLGCAHFLHADTLASSLSVNPEEKIEPFPWLTGPLLTPAGHVVPNGHYNIEPYAFITSNYGTYKPNWHTQSAKNNFYNINTNIFIQVGMPWDMDFDACPSWTWNHVEGASHWVLNDMSIGFDYQLLNDETGKWWPALKLQVHGNLPIGRYQKLNPKSKRTDISGFGTWAPGFGIVASHLYWWGGHIFFVPRLSISYTLPTPVHVKGYNTYGGGHHTRGKVFPGQSLLVLFGYEIALSQRWALAGDIQYQHINKTRFKGKKGATRGVPNRVGYPSSESVSLAPAIEYNWSVNYGIIAGAWFTVAGRNALEFTSGVIAVNIYH